MHIRYKELASIFAVRKASHMDGRDTLSVQFYDRHGTSAFKVFLTFGGKEVPVEKDQYFQELVRRFRKEGA
jgi:putative heme iron utilization protein